LAPRSDRNHHQRLGLVTGRTRTTRVYEIQHTKETSKSKYVFQFFIIVLMFKLVVLSPPLHASPVERRQLKSNVKVTRIFLQLSIKTSSSQRLSRKTEKWISNDCVHFKCLLTHCIFCKWSQTSLCFTNIS